MNQVFSFQPVDETDRTMVLDLQAFSQITDRDFFTVLKTRDGQQGLILLRGDPDLRSRIFTEVQQTAQGVTEFREDFVFSLGDTRRIWHRAFDTCKEEIISQKD